jgi:hypothetical protein
MTTRIITATKHLVMINPGSWTKPNCVMTGIAYIRTTNVSANFTRCNNSIVTQLTGTLYLVMINPDHWNPGRLVMTSLALICRIDMRHRLTRGISTVVT